MGALKTYLLAALLGLPALAHAQAWKCQIDGKTVFSDVPCKGTFIDTSKLNGNTVAPVKAPPPPPRQVREEFATAPMGGIVDSRVGARGVSAGCLSPIEIRNIETTLSSTSVGRDAARKRRLEKQLQRADWCKAGLDVAAMEAKEAEIEARRPVVHGGGSPPPPASPPNCQLRSNGNISCW